MLWWERSQGSFAAGAVAVVELRHGGASTRTQLAVGRRTRLGRSRSHGSCRSCEGQTDATGSKVRPQEHRQELSVVMISKASQQQQLRVCDACRFAPRQPRRPLGHSSSRPQPSSSFLFTLTPLAPAPPPAPAPALHAPCPAPACKTAATGKKKEAGGCCCSWELGGSWELGAGSCNSAGCPHFLSFRPGQLLQATPAILSCVPSQLHLTNCFVSTRRPSSVHQTRAHHSPPSITISCGKGDLDTGTMGLFTERDEDCTTTPTWLAPWQR